ncbi:MAG: ATP-binding protein [Opitutaceae bacterium]|nr:ATP-binding protein [Opitutaceae bacterium]
MDALSSSPLRSGATLTIDQKVEAEMTRLLYRSAGFGLYSNFVLALLLVAGTLRVHPLRVHVPWLATLVVVCLGRWALNMGMLQIIQQTRLNPEQKCQVEIAAGSADTLMRLLNDILDFSKIESGKLEFESIVFGLPATITEVVALLRSRAAEKRLELSLDLPANIPIHVVGDAVRLKQVLLNLTGNAIKFTEHGRVEISVRVLHRDEKVVTMRFSVRDTGMGMDEAMKAKLFQVFSQGDSSMTRRFGGTGLGLAISQKLVNRMGGHISVRSAPGAGSDFSFELTLPLGEPPSLESHAPLAVARPLAGRVLVVEDDRVNQRVIELMLKNLGLQSVIVADGAAAVDVATFEQWDAVLMDCQMAGRDGIEATRQIRGKLNGRVLPIIALTANAMATDRDACMAAGMDDFVAKPVRQHELRSCLERWVTHGCSRSAD